MAESEQCSSSPQIEVGGRLQVGEHRCTIRYIGEIQERKGVWVGVEWDNSDQGEHSGRIHEHQYFQTEHGEASGSFLGLEDIAVGTTLVEALIERYKNRGEVVYGDDESMIVQATRNKTKKIELVGEGAADRRQSKTHLLKTAELSESQIAKLVRVVGQGALHRQFTYLLPLIHRCYVIGMKFGPFS